MSASEARARRKVAAEKYKPEIIELLLVAEAPPDQLDRYFYFEDVREQDSLFRYVCKMLLGETPARADKAPRLADLKRKGVFLIDLSEDPKIGVDLAACVPRLVSRCVSLQPRRIILIKTNVYDLAYQQLKRRRLPVVAERIPFPGSGRQREFEQSFKRALEME